MKCKVCGLFESASIDEFRLHGINHCIPSIARYFGVTQLYDLSNLLVDQQQQQQQHDDDETRMVEEEEEEGTVKKRKRDHLQHNNDSITTTNKMIVESNNNSNDLPIVPPPPPPPPHPLPTTSNNNNNNNNINNTSTSLFKSLIKSPYIRHTLFKHINRVTELPHLGMISEYAMPWDFIKHNLPNEDSVLAKRRWYVISDYCSHQGAKLDTLLHLLKWSPDYDPQDQYEDCQQNLFYNVAYEGHRDILEYLVKRYPNIVMNGTQEALDVAAMKGHFSTVQLLSSMKQVKCTTSAMDKAASGGNLNIVKYLLENRTEGCTCRAIDSASRNGYLDVVIYLTENGKGCTTDAIENGHLDIVRYIVSNRNEKCTTQAVDVAIEKNCSLEIIKLLDQECTIGGLTSAIYNDRMDIVEYLYKKFPKSTRMWTRITFNEAASHGKLDFIKVFTTNAMNKAAANGHIDVVKFLHDYRTEGCSTDAMNKAARNGHIEIVKFLHLNRTEGCTPDAMDGAAQENNLEMVKWLHKNRSEGCTEFAILSSNCNPDIYTYILSNKLIPIELIKSGRIAQLPYGGDEKEDYYEIVDLINKYYYGDNGTK
ncbi:hypothetical protein DFA_04189 [Cavenderia fasciculata]|uniref:Ankyrin repeat-containing protein n=1 Tax=Cavenderia fasciculata TaxID=261658 RepID=F4Q1J2_CACFS|nr:uncharacterized protein DFA_04189 [Cavenderia fasciculata]EGG18693.1 hypothetical protein DFA_04189 [Cavenderia fasciculata]|eukprot:XP_004366597.1 hypothetical protein DFA_04189 [Cavenderia fasciculata]